MNDKSQNSGTRRQLSLFVPVGFGIELEAMRRILDPLQSRLIPAHVTLCREDEICDIPRDELANHFAGIQCGPFTLCFGRPSTFSGHGILLDCIAGEQAFHSLRANILGSTNIRMQQPHITLAHPRNPRALGNSLESAMRLPDQISITFPSVCLVEQVAGGPWTVLEEISLA